MMTKIGIISDTHGMLTRHALDALGGVDHILHAGDIGAPEVLQLLNTIAPVHAVRGNMDGGAWCRDLPLTDMVELDATTFYLLHDLNTLDLDPTVAGVQVVIHGHTHLTANKTHAGVLYFNPGSASRPGRPGGPLTMGILELNQGRIDSRIIALNR
jgi:putative phosphoesterase